ncbi:hypothetical protein BN946_scf185007.g79 [Trametes cinnabarina]|uniref:Uncharacterized protein n=1 Tax=Pycnoporus cinnabarinus TaxID=5643 RepID=A0A060SF66_PYCCI|nr:hypothetical protein BN946_scf185007.g79 [Trametes cinnabarina]
MHNITITVWIEEIPDEPDDFFQGSPLWKLHLVLDVPRSLPPLDVVIQQYTGTPDLHVAPTWLKELITVEGRSIRYTRQCSWIMMMLAFIALWPGILKNDDKEVEPWLDISNYIAGFRATFDGATRPRLPHTTSVPDYSEETTPLAQMAHLTLNDRAEEEAGYSWDMPELA